MRTTYLLALALLVGATGCFLDRNGVQWDARLDGRVDAAPLDGGRIDADVVLDGGRDGGVIDAGPPARITGLSYGVVAHGGATVASGERLAGATAVRIGAAEVPFIVVDQSLRIEVGDSVPVGAQQLSVETPNGVATHSITVIHLVISELDEETDSGFDFHQFLEIATAVPDVDLAGYVVVAFDGVTDTAYWSQPLGRVGASGRFVFGNATISPAPDVTIEGETLRGGPEINAIAIYQTASFAPGTTVTASGVIDALVHSRQSDSVDPGLAVLLTSGASLSEGSSDEQQCASSISRCGEARRESGAFTRTAPSPAFPNGC